MTNLTDKLRKGELPDNHHYYFKLPKSKEYEVGNTFCLETLRWCKDGNKIEVLSEVPSFEEYQKLLSDQLAKNDGVEINAELEAENAKLKTENKWYSEQLNEAVKEVAKLKELLTMAREVLKMVDTYSGDYDSINGFLIVEEIDQVLGE